MPAQWPVTVSGGGAPSLHARETAVARERRDTPTSSKRCAAAGAASRILNSRAVGRIHTSRGVVVPRTRHSQGLWLTTPGVIQFSAFVRVISKPFLERRMINLSGLLLVLLQVQAAAPESVRPLVPWDSAMDRSVRVTSTTGSAKGVLSSKDD